MNTPKVSQLYRIGIVEMEDGSVGLCGELIDKNKNITLFAISSQQLAAMNELQMKAQELRGEIEGHVTIAVSEEIDEDVTNKLLN